VPAAHANLFAAARDSAAAAAVPAEGKTLAAFCASREKLSSFERPLAQPAYGVEFSLLYE